jgi:hypothetical protein
MVKERFSSLLNEQMERKWYLKNSVENVFQFKRNMFCRKGYHGEWLDGVIHGKGIL